MVRETIWDNGHADFHFNGQGQLNDSTTGAHTGNASLVGHFADVPSTSNNFQLNLKVTCDGTGAVFVLHVGATEDAGGVWHFHGNI